MCEGDRTNRDGQGMLEVKLLCYMWLSPFLKLAQPSSFYTHLPAYEDGTVFRNVGI